MNYIYITLPLLNLFHKVPSANLPWSCGLIVVAATDNVVCVAATDNVV